MKNFIILGAGGNIARKVIDLVINEEDIHLTLFLRNAKRLKNRAGARCHIIEGKRQARWIRELSSIKVVFPKE